MDYVKTLTEKMLPFASHIGMEFVSATKDKVVARMVVRPELCTVPDILHGGAVMAFADTLGGSATILNLPDGAWTATLESKTNFLAAAPLGTTVTGETVPIHRGRRTMVWQTKVSTEQGRLVALVTQTQMVIETS